MANHQSETPLSSARAPRPVDHSVGFAVGIVGAAWAAAVIRDLWFEFLDVDTYMVWPWAFLVVGLAISGLGWWLTRRDLGPGSIAMAASRAAATTGSVLVGLAIVHALAAKGPGIFGAHLAQCCESSWLDFLKFDGPLVAAGVGLAVAGFAIERRYLHGR